MFTYGIIGPARGTHRRADFTASPSANPSEAVNVTTPPVRLAHRAATPQGLRVLPLAGLALLVLVAPCSALAKASADPSTIASSEAVTPATVPQFEVGLHGAATTETHDHANHLFVGLSIAYALRPWLVIGTEMDAMATTGLGGDYTSLLRETQPQYIRGAYQALVLGELRLALARDVVRPFVRAAIGPASVTHVDRSTAMVVATRVSVGVDLRLGHFYMRPCGFVETIATAALPIGFGLEAGATF